MVTAPEAPTLDEAREALAREWRERNPATPAEIAAFYRENHGQAADLEAWHATADRQAATDLIVAAVKAYGGARVVDIGCGAGHDLAALAEEFVDLRLHGVEPNELLRRRARETPELWRALFASDVADAPIESADWLICVDVLEHIPDPESFLGRIAERAPAGCFLFEATATTDVGTPLHLPANRGWDPGHCLELRGWRQIEMKEHTKEMGRLRIWKRLSTEAPTGATLILCAYRGVVMQTMGSIISLLADSRNQWRWRPKFGDALISRSRSAVASAWWKETAEDVFLMIDDDIEFLPGDADRLVQLCREGHDIICGAYAVRNGANLALRHFPGTEVIIGPGRPPLEIQYAATGFVAIHRRVLDAMVPTMPLVHAEWWPLFQPMTVEMGDAGHIYLSEDWAFCHRARDLGFKVWLDQSTRLRHHGVIPISPYNMADVFAAFGKA